MAAYRHAYGEDLGKREEELSKVEALDKIAEHVSGGSPGTLANRRPQSRFAYAKQLARSRNKVLVKEALDLLQELMDEHPFVQELAYESAFALLELAQLHRNDGNRKECEKRWSEADRMLKRAEAQFRSQMHHELLSRRGRLSKGRADACFADGSREEARAHYRRAAEAYSKASDVSPERERHYPAINTATCWWLADQRKEAKQAAMKARDLAKGEEKELRQELQQKPRDRADKNDKIMWALATQGEACVIAASSQETPAMAAAYWGEAETTYEKALDLAKSEGNLAQHNSTMIKQLERICQVAEADCRAELEELIQKLKQMAKR
jgi:hypothetical protein